MPVITVANKNCSFEYQPGDTLLNILLANSVYVDNACNGNGTCGKCRVKLLSGVLPEPGDTEAKLLKQGELESGVRMSCLVYPSEDITVEVLQKERKHEVLTTGHMPEFDFKLDIEKQLVTIHKPTLEDQTPFEDQIMQQTGASSVDQTAVHKPHIAPGEYTAVLHEGRVIDLEPGDTTDKLYGVAIDIGTTTVVCELVDLHTGEALSSASEINAQKHFGLDVLTRITYEQGHPENGVANLQKAIVKSINKMVDQACRQVFVDTQYIYEFTVGANCTMMHMLLGVDATCIGKAPFAPVFVKSRNILASEIGLQGAAGSRLYCLPSVSAYIGADIVAGAYVCKLKDEPGNALFIDIGTNGEIVLASHGKLLSCSCAAGPALEGMNISSGMRAQEGAIEDVFITEDGVQLKVIGGIEPTGICGSGILTVMRELLKSGIVRKTGAFVKANKFSEDDYRHSLIETDEDGKRSFILTESPEKLLITQGDVRQVQLAKGAILSGFVALLRKAGIDMADLDKVLIAGQFGAHLPADSMTGTGILPEEVEDRLVYVGNTSKTGAYMALMSSDVKRGMERLAEDMDYMELGATENYERLFSECLVFPGK